MFRVLCLTILLSTAVAFMPAGRMARSSAMSMQFEDELGVLPPVGFWDPLGLSKTADAEKFRRWRAVELKHGRISMAAVVGYLVQETTRWPGYVAPPVKFEDVPNGVGAFTAIPLLGWLQIIAFIGFLEKIQVQEEGAEPGTFGTGYFTEGGRIGDLPPDAKVEKLTKELQNGRLAMLGIMELLTHDVAKPAGEGLFVLHHF